MAGGVWQQSDAGVIVWVPRTDSDLEGTQQSLLRLSMGADEVQGKLLCTVVTPVIKRMLIA